jgi:hypothetical protein
MAVVPRGSPAASTSTQIDNPSLEFGAAQATAPRRREIKWVYLTPLMFLFLPLINYGARS